MTSWPPKGQEVFCWDRQQTGPKRANQGGTNRRDSTRPRQTTRFTEGTSTVTTEGAQKGNGDDVSKDRGHPGPALYDPMASLAPSAVEQVPLARPPPSCPTAPGPTASSPKAPAGPASTCAMETRRSSTRWTPSASCAVPDADRRRLQRRSRSGSPPPARPTSTSSASSSTRRPYSARRRDPGAHAVRQGLIERTFVSLAGACTAPALRTTRWPELQRRVVFPGAEQGRHRRHARSRRPSSAKQLEHDLHEQRHHPALPRVLARELHRHRGRVRRGDLRGGDGRHCPTPENPMILKSPGHGRDVLTPTSTPT